MSKDIEWLIEEVLNLYPEMYKHPDYQSGEKIDLINNFIGLIDELDEPEKIVIPQFVADHIEKHKGEELNLISRLDFVGEEEFEKKTKEWLYGDSYEENLKHQYLLIDATRYGYEVEKEPVYYAKIKGHELVETETVLDDDTGDDISEFHRNVYFVLQRNGQLVVDMKDSGLSGAKHFMTMSQWGNLGINEANADFEDAN